MKKSLFFAAIAAAILSNEAAQAQIGIHIGLHFGGAPVVYTPAPVENVQYDDNDDYYYLPDADAYYCVPEHVYYFMNGDRWTSAPYLPGRFHDFDWRYARRYEVRAPRPYMHHDMYRERFKGFAGGNPDWRGNDSRFHGDTFGHGSYADNGGYHNHWNDGGYGRPNSPYDQFHGHNRNGQGDYDNQNNHGQYNNNGYDRGGQNQYGNQGNSGYPASNQNNQPQYNQPNRGQGENSGYGQGQYNHGQNNPNNGQGQSGQYNRGQNGGYQNQNNQPASSNQGNGRERGAGNPQQHFANFNGPGYNHDNGFTRPGRF